MVAVAFGDVAVGVVRTPALFLAIVGPSKGVWSRIGCRAAHANPMRKAAAVGHRAGIGKRMTVLLMVDAGVHAQHVAEAVVAVADAGPSSRNGCGGQVERVPDARQTIQIVVLEDLRVAARVAGPAHRFGPHIVDAHADSNTPSKVY